jgi:hypothetical protein
MSTTHLDKSFNRPNFGDKVTTWNHFSSKMIANFGDKVTAWNKFCMLKT